MGKRNLERALEQYRSRHPDAEEPAVRWLPFQLNPQIPERGMPRAEYLTRKFGNPKGNYGRVTAVGASVGIPFQFDRIAVQPNTLLAHRLLTYAERAGRQNEVAEAVFRAYFIEGADLTDAECLADLAVASGLDRAPVATYLAGDEDRDAVVAADAEARSVVDGVPYFIVNRKIGVPGAQEPAVLLDALEKSVT